MMTDGSQKAVADCETKLLKQLEGMKKAATAADWKAAQRLVRELRQAQDAE